MNDKVTETKNNTECIELKNIKYKSILMNGSDTLIETQTNTNLENLETYLQTQTDKNKLESWNKLNKTNKLRKLELYARLYVEKNFSDNLDQHTEVLLSYFRDCLDKKKLNKAKDVLYDKSIMEIKDIPGLLHIKNLNRYTIKNPVLNNTKKTKKGINKIV